MTKRKDPQPEAEEPHDTSPPVEPAAVEPFVVTDPAEPLPETPHNPPAAGPVTPESRLTVRRGSIFAPLLGGALAAVGGFALSHFDAFGLRPVAPASDMAALAERLDRLEARTGPLDGVPADLSALSARIAQLESAPTPEVPDLSRLEALDQRLAAIEAMPADGVASTTAVSAKLAELERRIAGMAPGVSPELQQQLDAAVARLDEAEANAKRRAEEAETAAAAATRAKALDLLADKVVSGEPFAAELQALNDSKLNQVLGPLADSGAQTLEAVQRTFPDAARETLRIARETSADDGWGDRFLDFLAAQTGARSLAPREGTTPDAILSRADFALSEGRVADAIAEIEALEPAIRTAFDPWLAQAQSYLAVTAALQAAREE